MDAERLAKEISQLKNTMKLIPHLSSFDEFQETIDISVTILEQISVVEGYMFADEKHFRGDVFVKIKGL
jgi:hypothetical protein